MHSAERRPMPPRKKLIIVSDDSSMRYASYLMQLISNQERGDKDTSPQSEAIDTTVWTEKHYDDSLAALTTSTYVLFIGNGKVAKRSRANIPMKFDRMGMHYGWLGTQGCLFVDAHSLNRNNYAEFRELCGRYDKTFDSTLPLLEGKGRKTSAKAIPAEGVILEDVSNDEDGIMPDEPQESGKRGIARLNPRAVTSSIGAFLSDKANEISTQTGAYLSSGRALQRQYSLLVLIMYRDGLPQFLGSR